ncbi:hypothetical protein N7510_003095 [Penicillium lagena]|uniref:uncharacterized protein n=1 Tax=Penicillium lagena TaxID=94218 RepID=UPI002540297D|nr:uncharacterized protein N7510_003095 [Penicillium lagena]KAJ5619111.1 hypothetical protein N7510_003095 [Penicillium lagena]
MRSSQEKDEFEIDHLDNIEANTPGTEFTDHEKKKIIRRVDRRLVTMCGLTACVSLMDRTNISSAAIAGMNEDLQLTQDNRYSVVVLVFFITYVLGQAPATATVRHFGARWFLSTLVLLWGVTMIAFGFLHTWQQMTALRLLLGLFEGGFFPGIIFLLSTWYVRYELQKRYAGYYIIGMVASAFSGILAFGLTKMQGVGGLDGFRWIFIIEGILTCLVGGLCYAFLPDFPDYECKSISRMSFLSRAECMFMIHRVQQDRGDQDMEEFRWAKFFAPALDLKIWAFAIIFCAATAVCYSVAYFLPIILSGSMGFSVGASQCLVAPPYVFAGIVMAAEAWIGDRYHIRGPIIVANCLMAVCGLALMAYGQSAVVQFVGCFLLTAGGNSSIPSILTYQANNIRGQWSRAFSSASIVGFGGIGGIVGGLIFRTQDAPRYIPGTWASIGLMLLVVALVAALSIYFRLQNKRADRGEIVLEGHEGFRYTI